MANLKVSVLNKAHQIIQESDYKKKDDLYYILYVIDTQTNRFNYKDDNIGDHSGYVYVPDRYFKSILHPREIQNSKQFLINNKIIDCDNKSNFDPKNGELKALGYKYNNSMFDLFSEWVEVELDDNISSKMKNKINGNKVRTKNLKLNKVIVDKNKLHNRHKLFQAKQHYINNFDIDEVKALKHIENDLLLDLENLYNNYFIQGLFKVNLYTATYKYVNKKIVKPEQNKYSLSFIDEVEDMFNDIFSGEVECNNQLNSLMESKTGKERERICSILNHFLLQPTNNLYSRNFSRKLFNEYNEKRIKLIKKKLYRESKINSIKTRKYFNQSKTNGRVNTNLTTLNKKYKQYIISDKPLVSIDISNSQPYFLSLYLDNLRDTIDIDVEELDRFIDVCRKGKLYDDIADKTKSDRQTIKDDIITKLYSMDRRSNTFRTAFPSIMNYLDNYKIKITNSKFAIDIQTLESNLCINRIVPKLFENNIECYTIHDSWLVYEEDVDKALDIIKNIFMDEYNSLPNFKIEKVNF